MSQEENRLFLPRFKARLKRHEKTMSAGTYWRYSNGILPPPLGTLFMEDPELVEELAKDLRALGLMKEEAAHV